MSSFRGVDSESIIGANNAMFSHINNSGNTVINIQALNAGVAFRFRAFSTADIKTVNVAFAALTSDFRCKAEIWTIDAATGKPAAIYDANATFTKTSALTANALNQFTFATTPTTALVVGDEYAIVIITTTAGASTACNLCLSPGGSFSITADTINYLTTTDAGTTWTYVTSPIANVCSYIDENGVEYSTGMHPFINAYASAYIQTTNIVASKVVINTTVVVRGVFAVLSKAGTPAGDLRCRIVDTNNTLVTNADITLDVDSLVNSGGGANRRILCPFTSLVTLVPGTYRVIFSSPNSANTSNCWIVRVLTPFTVDSYNYAQCLYSYGTSDGADAIPTSWTDSATYQCVGVQLLVDSFSVPDFPIAGNVTEDDTVNGVTGTYHETAVAEVQAGVTFGANSGLTGTYSPDFPDVDAVLTTDTVNGANGHYHAPDASEVWHTATYGVDGSTAGTKVASSIENCSADNIKKNVSIDDVTGTYESVGGSGQTTLMGGGL